MKQISKLVLALFMVAPVLGWADGHSTNPDDYEGSVPLIQAYFNNGGGADKEPSEGSAYYKNNGDGTYSVLVLLEDGLYLMPGTDGEQTIKDGSTKIADENLNENYEVIYNNNGDPIGYVIQFEYSGTSLEGLTVHALTMDDDTYGNMFPDGIPREGVPIDGYLVFLLIGGVLFGIYATRKHTAVA